MFRTFPFPTDGIVEGPDGGRTINDELSLEVTDLFNTANRRGGGAMFDGLLFSAEQFDERRIVGHFVRYSLFIAQLEKPELFDVLQVRPLGVSGLLTCDDGVVFGRRHTALTLDAGLWELVPSGGVDPSCRNGGGRIDVVGQTLDELHEEAGIGREHVKSASPFALAENLDTHVIEVAIDIAVPLDGQEVQRLFRQGGSGEYTELVVVPRDEIPFFAERWKGEMVGASQIVLRLKGLW